MLDTLSKYVPVPASRQEVHSFHWICPSGLNTHTHTYAHARAHTWVGGHLHPTLGSSDFTAASTVRMHLLLPLHGAVGNEGKGKAEAAQFLPALRSTLRAVGCQATMPTLFEWPSKMTTGSVRERVSPFSGICHTCWKRKKGDPHESGRLLLSHLL